MNSDFSLAVVGLGLVGSAALRHAAASGSVVGIGPSEPSDWTAHTGAFASHYDSGRVTRRLDARREWSILATRSIENYSRLEEQSNITFHTPAGMAYVRKDQRGIDQQRAIASEFGIDIDECSAPAPYVFSNDWTCLFEQAPAGHIDPRKMIDAQHRVAQTRGAELIRSEARSVAREGTSFRVRIDDGSELTAERVIIATGSYGNECTVQPLAVSIRSEAVMLCEVDSATAASLVMPSLIWLIDHPELIDVYVVPPVLYPDGRWYLKIGGEWSPGPLLADEASRLAWMRGTDADARMGLMREVVDELLPDVPFVSFAMKPCVITDTATGLPFIGIVGDGRVVARGGNGHAAKSADAIGSLAVGLARNGEWTDPELDEADFRPVFIAS